MTESNSRQAWDDFWAHDARGEANGRGCLPARWTAIENAQQRAWANFTADLPQGARILDLATGDGRVLGWMSAERSDLNLTGIDLAHELPAPPEGTVTHGGVRMEELPCETASFEAVVSQFGFEYGDVRFVAAEIARVIARDGRVGLMVHRGDGPILEHNLRRKAAIDWVLGEKRLVSLIGNALDAENGGPHAAAQVAAAIGMLGTRTFGEASPAWEIPEAMRRAILLGARRDKASINDTLHTIEERAGNEVGRIRSLADACDTADAREELVAAFSANGLDQHDSQTVCEPSGRAFADFLTFR